MPTHPKHPDDLRTHHLPVRFTRRELDGLRREARRRGMTLAAFTRALLHVGCLVGKESGAG